MSLIKELRNTIINNDIDSFLEFQIHPYKVKDYINKLLDLNMKKILKQKSCDWVFTLQKVKSDNTVYTFDSMIKPHINDDLKYIINEYIIKFKNDQYFIYLKIKLSNDNEIILSMDTSYAIVRHTEEIWTPCYYDEKTNTLYDHINQFNNY